MSTQPLPADVAEWMGLDTDIAGILLATADQGALTREAG